MAFELHGKTAFVTGGASGIGLAVARLFINQGARVVIADINDPAEIAAGIGAFGVRCDVSEETSVEKALSEATTLLNGKIDIVILNAGIGTVGPNLEESSSELVERVTQVNYYGVVYGLKHAPAVMNDHGAIVCTASLAAYVNVPGSAIYSASKRAVVSLTEMAALELGGRGIRVNCVCPGYVDTDIVRAAVSEIVSKTGRTEEDAMQHFTESNPQGRLIEASEVASAVSWLGSDGAASVTGQAVAIDGGGTA